jgi:Skp family chaperone for outer membrane proteins
MEAQGVEMKLINLLLAGLVLALLATLGLGQTAGGPAAAASSGQKTKIAFINSAELQAKLNDYKQKVDELNHQFEPRVKEIQTLIDRINALETTIKTQSGVLPPAKIAEMTDQLNEMKVQQKRKAEDLQADGERARNQQLAPFKEKLQKFLQQFTAKHDISLLVDLANGLESNTIVWFDPRADLSAAFIAEYNAANPVPASATAPKP